MNKQHFIAFAQEARNWRAEAKDWETQSRNATDLKDRALFEKSAEVAYLQALAIEAVVIKVGTRFNPRFDEVRFRQACNPDIPLKL